MSLNWQTSTAKPSVNILCWYTNNTQKIQLMRVTNNQNINLEKIVFPQERTLFEATTEGQLEIYTSQVEKRKSAQIIPCQKLQVNQVLQK